MKAGPQVIGQDTTDLPESNQNIHSFLSITVTQAIFKKRGFLLINKIIGLRLNHEPLGVCK